MHKKQIATHMEAHKLQKMLYLSCYKMMDGWDGWMDTDYFLYNLAINRQQTKYLSI